MALKGQNLRIQLSTSYIGQSGAFIGLAKSCDWNTDAQVEDVTTKDTPTGQSEKDCTGVERNFSTSHLIVDGAQIASWDAAVGSRVSYMFTETSGEQNKDFDYENPIHSGAAILKSVHVSAQDRQFATLEISCDVTY